MRRQVDRLQFLGSFQGQLPDTGLPEVAFAGRSNVGKSSLLNRMLNRKSAARVSNTPGRTQSINLFQVGEACVFADLPGYGFAKVPPQVMEAWKAWIEAYLAEREPLRLVVMLVDARRDPQALDLQLTDALDQLQRRSVVVATKVDKLGKQEKARQLAAIRRAYRLDAAGPIAFSAVTGEGRDALWDAVEAACGWQGDAA